MGFDEDRFDKDLRESLQGTGWWFYKTNKNHIIVLERLVSEESLALKVQDLLEIEFVSSMLRKIKDININKEKIRITCFTQSLKDMGYEY